MFLFSIQERINTLDELHHLLEASVMGTVSGKSQGNDVFLPRGVTEDTLWLVNDFGQRPARDGREKEKMGPRQGSGALKPGGSPNQRNRERLLHS